MKKVCPLMIVTGKVGMKLDCLENKCAWWYDDEDENDIFHGCALLVIAEKLSSLHVQMIDDVDE